jgi:hypothetical protein
MLYFFQAFRSLSSCSPNRINRVLAPLEHSKPQKMDDVSFVIPSEGA